MSFCIFWRFTYLAYIPAQNDLVPFYWRTMLFHMNLPPSPHTKHPVEIISTDKKDHAQGFFAGWSAAGADLVCNGGLQLFVWWPSLSIFDSPGGWNIGLLILRKSWKNFFKHVDIWGTGFYSCLCNFQSISRYHHQYWCHHSIYFISLINRTYLLLRSLVRSTLLVCYVDERYNQFFLSWCFVLWVLSP